MYSISKFSKLTGVSTKALIWYDNIGLLKPNFVNEENGYRYYSAEAIKKLANIQYFQSLGFTINEIMNLSKDVISSKVQYLRNKISYIESNISFLESLKEETMNGKTLSIYDIQSSKEHQARLQGKWVYAMSTNNFTEAILPCPTRTKSKAMPKEIFFGEKQTGTDTENILYYSLDKINIREKTYNFLIMNLDENLILFERQDPYAENAKDEKLYFHVYQRLGNTPYTRGQLEDIIAEAAYRKPKLDAKFCENDGRFDGIWQHIDNIKESEIGAYLEKDNKDKLNILFPMFDKVYISGQKVDVMSDDDSLTINNQTTYTKANSKMKLRIYPNDIFIDNLILGVRQKVLTKNIDGEEYMFVNFTNDLDIDQNTTVYVYKKVKGE